MLQNLKIVLKPLQTVKRLSILSFELLYKNETATDIFLMRPQRYDSKINANNKIIMLQFIALKSEEKKNVISRLNCN